MTDREIILWLWKYGHFHETDVKQSDLAKLSLADESVKQAVRSIQSLDANLHLLVAKHHGRSFAIADGDVGPATRELLALPRCGMPDFGEDVQQAPGTGSWKGCHGHSDEHTALIKIYAAHRPSFLDKETFNQVLRHVITAQAEIGLRFLFVDESNKDWFTGEPRSGNVNIDFQFVRSGNGWIGLAIVGRNQSCGSTIWCKHAASYRPSDIVAQWYALVLHECGGHNCGLGHSSGGIMNPSLIRPSVVGRWADNDPSKPLMKRYFGGVPIDGDDPDPGPNPPSPPDGCQKFFESINKLIAVCMGNDEDWEW